MERLKSMKENLMSCVQSQMGDLKNVDAKELGEAVDMIKDLSEAIYYCTITEAMGEQKHQEERHYYPVYYNMTPTSYGNGSGSNNGSNMYYTEPTTNYNRGSMNYSYGDEMPVHFARDTREGRSGQSRRMYMESKEMHQPKTTQMKELEKYMQELTADISEMIQDASPEEKALLEKKVFALANKIGQA